MIDGLVAIDPRPLAQMTRYILENLDDFTQYVRVSYCRGCGERHNADIDKDTLRTNLNRVLEAADEAWGVKTEDTPEGFVPLDEFIPDPADDR